MIPTIALLVLTKVLNSLMVNSLGIMCHFFPNNCTWTNVRNLHLGFELFNTIFHQMIVWQKLSTAELGKLCSSVSVFVDHWVWYILRFMDVLVGIVLLLPELTFVKEGSMIIARRQGHSTWIVAPITKLKAYYCSFSMNEMDNVSGFCYNMIDRQHQTLKLLYHPLDSDGDGAYLQIELTWFYLSFIHCLLKRQKWPFDQTNKST